MLRFQYNEWLKSGITKWGIFSAKSGYFYYAIHIKMVTDPEGQVVLEERYLCYAKWEDIASELGYTVRQIFRVHDAALKEIVVPESCQ